MHRYTSIYCAYDDDNDDDDDDGTMEFCLLSVR